MMLVNYPSLEKLFAAGFTGDRDGFREKLELLKARATELDDDAVLSLIKKVSEVGERGRYEDKTDVSQKREAFEKKLGSIDDIPIGLLLNVTNVTIDEVILSKAVKMVIQEFLEEQTHSEAYFDFGLDPQNRMLLVGPPGNGKTEVTKAIANYLKCPLYFVRYDDLVSKQPGETSKRLNTIFQFAKSHRCILFFDEIDAIAKDRGDESQTGEMKAVVSTLLVQMDDVPPHVICIGATNHMELIDKAMFRRFQNRITLPDPEWEQYEEYFKMKFATKDFYPNMDLKMLAYELEPENFSEAAGFVDNCFREYVRKEKKISIEEAIQYAAMMWPKKRVKMTR